MRYSLIFVILVITGCSKTNNLIINPGAELPPVENGWVQLTGKWKQRAKDPLPQEGKSYFFAGNVANAELYQDIDVASYAGAIDKGFMQADYSAYMHSWRQRPADEAIEVIEYRDASGNVLDSFKTASYTNTDAWIRVADKRTVSKNTRIIRVRLLAIRHAGSNNDGYHDDLSLTLKKQIPLYLILIIIAVVLIISFLLIRKKRKEKK